MVIKIIIIIIIITIITTIITIISGCTILAPNEHRNRHK